MKQGGMMFNVLKNIVSVHVMIVAMLVVCLPVIARADVATPLQTGQKLCFDTAGSVQACNGGSIAGQDGYYRTGAFWDNTRFSIVTSGPTAGTITDNTTGLVWPMDATTLPIVCGIAPGSGVSWANALLYVGCLNAYDGSGYLGITTWRLPNIIEMMSLVNRGHGESTPTYYNWTSAAGINNTAQTNVMWLTQAGTPGNGNKLDNSFSNLTIGLYWSSTSNSTASSALAVNMITDTHVAIAKNVNSSHLIPVSGTTTILPQTGQTTCYNATGSVIACSGTGQDGDTLQGVTPPATRFTLVTASDAKTCITDNYTGLVWSGSDTTAGLYGDYNSAMDAITNSNNNNGYCGYTDWRMPNVNEMVSLMNFGQISQDAWLRTSGFSSAVAVPAAYWTSTASDLDPTQRFVVDMSSGSNALVNTQLDTTSSRFLMVRSGQFTITGKSNNTGTVSCSPSTITAGIGASSTCTITPATGYQIDTSSGSGLSDNGVDVTTSGDPASTQTYTISNINASHTVRGNFTLRHFTIKYAVSGADSASAYSSGCGTTVGVPFNAFTTQTCQITLLPGYAVKTFTDNGIDVTATLVNGTTYTMSNILLNHTLQVSFDAAYPIAASVSGGSGAISCTPSTVASGGTSVCTVAPMAGYSLSMLIDNGTNVTMMVVGGIAYTITNVTSSHNIVATFAPAYPITSSVSGGTGTISCTPSTVVSGGTSVCTVAPGAGYALSRLMDNLVTDVTAMVVGGTTNTITNVTSPHNIVATFSLTTTPTPTPTPTPTSSCTS
ncbi:MAG: DUF1566 domain-containing protein, partial [Nitrospirae bacterium]|nr:DUF1566 domain-containing protein [Nitrospirota bacterium]